MEQQLLDLANQAREGFLNYHPVIYGPDGVSFTWDGIVTIAGLLTIGAVYSVWRIRRQRWKMRQIETAVAQCMSVHVDQTAQNKVEGLLFNTKLHKFFDQLKEEGQISPENLRSRYSQVMNVFKLPKWEDPKPNLEFTKAKIKHRMNGGATPAPKFPDSTVMPKPRSAFETYFRALTK